MKRLLTGAMIVALVCSVIANVLMYLRYSTSRPLLTMGDTVITRRDYRDALDSQHGKGVLRKLVLARLVNREAAKAGLMPTDAEVLARVAELERTSPTVVQRAKQDVVAAYNLQQDTKTDIALERLRMRGVKVSDEDVLDYYRANSVLFQRPMQVQATAVVATSANDATIAANLLRQNLKPYMIARQPRLRVLGVDGFQPDLTKLTPAETTRMQSTMAAMLPGQVATLPLKENYLIFRVNGQSKMEVIPFAAAKQDAIRLAKLAKAPTAEEVLVGLYKDAHPVFEANQYAEYFRELEEAHTGSVKAVSLQSAPPKQTASR